MSQRLRPLRVGASVTVVDVGVALVSFPSPRGLLSRKIAYGTADLSQAPRDDRSPGRRRPRGGIEVASSLVASAPAA
ncbi:hypothetical protein GCM10020219_011110 [Nonomuraea dietziae]